MKLPSARNIAISIGLGSIAWGFCLGVWRHPVIAAIGCGVFILLAGLTGQPFHELVGLLYWFIGIFILIGLGGLLVTGNVASALIGFVFLGGVIMALTDNGVINYMNNGNTTPEERAFAWHMQLGCQYGSSYEPLDHSPVDGYCHRWPDYDSVKSRFQTEVPLLSVPGAWGGGEPVAGAVENIERLRITGAAIQAAQPQPTTSSNWIIRTLMHVCHHWVIFLLVLLIGWKWDRVSGIFRRGLKAVT